MNNFSAPAHLKSTTSTPESTALQRTDALDIEPISYYPLAFISCALPYQDPRKRPDLLAPTEAFSWSRHDGVLSMSLDAGSYIDGDGTKRFHLPYGLYPRVLLMWLTTSALKHQSRTFPLPSSARGLLSDDDAGRIGRVGSRIFDPRNHVQAPRISAGRPALLSR